MKNIKYIVWSIVLLVWIVFAYFFFVVNPTNANPDYICVKDVSRSCEVDRSTCSEWDEDGFRTCEWTRVTQVWYYHTRTACEEGYEKEIEWSTASDNTAAKYADSSSLDEEGKNADKKHPSSGRHSTDFDYWTETCTVKEVDSVRPEGEVEQVTDLEG